MVSAKAVNTRLRELHIKVPFWIEPEIRELTRILTPSETIMRLVHGRYEGGIALMCATDMRLLLVDKKPFYLTLEDVRYDMITNVDYRQRLVNATIEITSLNKSVRFTSFKQDQLRGLIDYVQQRVMELRSNQHFYQDQVQESQPQQQYPQPLPDNQALTNQALQSAQQATQQNRNPYSRMPLVTRERMIQFYSSRG